MCVCVCVCVFACVVPQDLASEGAGEEEEEGALGDVVEEELAATSQAVEEATQRIQVRSPSYLFLRLYVTEPLLYVYRRKYPD